MGASLWATVRSIGVDDTNLWSHLPIYTATTALAVVLGFVSMLPAGVGVRDLVLMQLLAPLLSEIVPNQGQALALVAAIMLRLVWLVAESLLAAVLYPLARKPRRSNHILARFPDRARVPLALPVLRRPTACSQPLEMHFPASYAASMAETQPHRKRIQHFHEPGDLHELTFSCYRWLPLLTNDEWREAAGRLDRRRGRGNGMQLAAFVLMPEHVHLLVVPTSPDPTIDLYLAKIKQPFSKSIKQRLVQQVAADCDSR